MHDILRWMYLCNQLQLLKIIEDSGVETYLHCLSTSKLNFQPLAKIWNQKTRQRFVFQCSYKVLQTFCRWIKRNYNSSNYDKKMKLSQSSNSSSSCGGSMQ
jgi:hypothetical protein